jgi:hypothetical protein
MEGALPPRPSSAVKAAAQGRCYGRRADGESGCTQPKRTGGLPIDCGRAPRLHSGVKRGGPELHAKRIKVLAGPGGAFVLNVGYMAKRGLDPMLLVQSLVFDDSRIGI